MFARVHSGALVGVDAVVVSVEVDLGPGIQSFHIAGLPDGAVREARIRVKSALENSDLAWPMRRVALNLAPADIRKDGTAYDLPIALSVLCAMGSIRTKEAERLGRYLVAGELGLDGSVRPIRGVLPLAICARDQGFEGIVVPADNANEAALVTGLRVVPCATLSDALLFARSPDQIPDVDRAGLLSDDESPYVIDMADVSGQSAAKRALEVAAAGGHNVLLMGPPGSGKSMLSKRLLTILPEMEFEEALETTKIYSVSGLVTPSTLSRSRPFRSPHHTISDVGIVGGGTGMPRPGELSLAHNGILFLDELPEFRRTVLEVMRQPLEDGEVTINRSLQTVTYPANIMLVASMNPCPCGYLGHPTIQCTDTALQVANYRNRISGPLLDRIDLHVEVPAVAYKDLRTAGSAESSANIRARVKEARSLQIGRLSSAGLHCNAQMGPRELRAYCELDEGGHKLMSRVIDRLGMSARACDRILKVSRTIADLAGSPTIERAHVAEAIQYRKLDRQQHM